MDDLNKVTYLWMGFECSVCHEPITDEANAYSIHDADGRRTGYACKQCGDRHITRS